MGAHVEAVINTKADDQLASRYPWRGHIDLDQRG